MSRVAGPGLQEETRPFLTTPRGQLVAGDEQPLRAEVTRHHVSLSSCELSLERDPLREPPRPLALRHPDYEDLFDFTTLVFDCFWNAHGDAVVLIGPAEYNLAADLNLTVVAHPSQAPCQRRVLASDHLSRSSVAVPRDTTAVSVRAGDNEFYLAPQPSMCHIFRDRRVITTLSKDNEPQWIRDWIVFHQKRHQCDGVLIYDNGSTRYSISELYDELGDLCAEMAIVLVSWPFKYGVADWRRPLSYRLGDSLFCQLGMLEHARRRFLAEAKSVLNVDVDELVITGAGTSVFELVERSPTGYLDFPGQWVEYYPRSAAAEAELPRHKKFWHVSSGYRCHRKWAMVPWKMPDEGQWLVHRTIGLPASEPEEDIELRHFKAISTDWNLDKHRSVAVRTESPVPGADALRPDHALQAAFDEVFASERAAPCRPQTPQAPTRRSWPAYRLRARAGRLAAAEHWTEAIEAAQAALHLMPEHPGLHLFLAEMYQKIGKPEVAERHVAEATALRAGAAWYHCQEGRWHLDEGDVVSARQCFERALKSDPSFTVAYDHMMETETFLGRPASALALVEQRCRHAPLDAMSHLLRARELERRGRLTDALTTCSTVLSFEPTNPWVLRLKARLLRRLGRLEEAEEAIREGMASYSLARTMEVRESNVVPAGTRTLSEAVGQELLMELAEVMILRGDLSAAEKAAREALIASRITASSCQFLAKILTLQGKEQEACAWLDRGISIANREATDAPLEIEGIINRHRRYVSRMHQLALILRAAGRRGEAVKMLQEAVPTKPDSIRLRSGLAELLAESGDLQAAEEMLRTAIGHKPEVAELHARLSVLLAGRDWIGAVEAARAAVEIEPDNTILQGRLANYLMKIGNDEEAEEILNGAVQIEPNEAELQFLLSQVLQRRKRLDAATQAARRATELAPQSLKFRNHLADLFADQGLSEEAEATLREAVQQGLASAATHYRLSRCLQDRGCLDEAVAAAASAVELEPDSTAFVRHLALLLMQMGQEAEAERVLADALKVMPECGRLHFQLSQVLRRRGRVEDAVDAARRAVALEPQTPHLRNHLAALLVEQGQFEEAETVLRQALQEGVGNGTTHYRLSRLLHRRGCLTEALAAASCAVQLEPDKALLRRHSADLLMESGQKEEAERVLLG